MKNFIHAAMVCAFVLISCQKDDSIVVTENGQDLVSTTTELPTVFMLSTESGEIQEIPVEDLDLAARKTSTFDRSPNTRAFGHFSGSAPNSGYQGFTITFNAVNNPQGTTGNAVVSVDTGTSSWQVIAQTEQVFVEDNDAIYCGVIINESGDIPPFPGSYQGYNITFRVVDNGKPNSNDKDQYFNRIFLYDTRDGGPFGGGGMTCETYDHSSFLWTFLGGGAQDVEKRSDNITVK